MKMIINGQLFKLKSSPDYYVKDPQGTKLWVLHNGVDIQGNDHVIFCDENKKIQIAPRDAFIAQTIKSTIYAADYTRFEDIKVRFNAQGENLPVVYNAGEKF
jgi:hypothetical protein